MAASKGLFAARAHQSLAKGPHGEKIAACRAALAAAPGNAIAAHNLASALGDAGLWAEAEPHIRGAITSGGAPESWLVLARCLQSRGAFDDADNAYREALARRPAYDAAHVDLAQLIWMRTGDSALARQTIERAAASAPADPRLALAKAVILENTGAIGDAYALMQSLADSFPDLAMFAIRAANLAQELAEHAAAVAFAERAVSLGPKDPAASIALASACLGAGALSRAEVAAQSALEVAPHDQHALALLATAWRAGGDERYGGLYDYDALIQTARLDTPPGWTTLDAYLADLRAALARAHLGRAHPFNQSVRQATQRPDILTIDDPACAALQHALDGPIQRYVDGLGSGDDPLRQRNRGGYAYQGVWSVRMEAGGRHVPHIHPRGWISSACYVEVPSTLRGEEGRLQFGEPGVTMSPVLAPERSIRPEPGMVVLFPSYMWHGVAPYAGPGVRMTFAFDLEPAEPGHGTRA